MYSKQYENLIQAAAQIKDQKLIDLVQSVGPFLGTEDGSKDDAELALFSEVSRAIMYAKSDIVSKNGNRITRRWRKDAIHYNAVNAYTNNLFKFCNEEGDLVLHSILERMLEILKPQ